MDNEISSEIKRFEALNAGHLPTLKGGPNRHSRRVSQSLYKSFSLPTEEIDRSRLTPKGGGHTAFRRDRVEVGNSS
jgi:hypothetical protein